MATFRERETRYLSPRSDVLHVSCGALPRWTKSSRAVMSRTVNGAPVALACLVSSTLRGFLIAWALPTIGPHLVFSAERPLQEDCVCHARGETNNNGSANTQLRRGISLATALRRGPERNLVFASRTATARKNDRPRGASFNTSVNGPRGRGRHLLKDWPSAF